MSDLNNLVLGHFLQHQTWLEAKKLLDYQIFLKSTHRHLNTFNFFYFERIKSKTKKLQGKQYFKNRVGNNFFYGLTKEFFFKQYTIPKAGIGLRKYFFFSYPMLVLYYAIGLYLLRISEQFIDDNKRPSIKSFYGGNLKFDSSGHLNLKKDSVLYYKHYADFKKLLTAEASKPRNKVVIRLDIQNYFENISIKQLLNLLSENIKPSIKEKNRFDKATKNLIHFYFTFLNNGGDSVPQSDNNIISSFISYLYLVFGDLIIEDVINELNSQSNIVKDFKIVRYVDDIFIILEFRTSHGTDVSLKKKARQNFTYMILNLIADEFYRKLGLRFNDKARIFQISRLEERKEFLKLIKKVSENYTIPEDELTNPEGKFDRLLYLISKIKNEVVSKVYEEREPNETETLKDAYDPKLEELIASDATYAQRIAAVFLNFNFDLFRIYPQVFIILVNKASQSKKIFEQFLLSKKKLTTFDRDLIINQLCQNKFNNKKLIRKLVEDPQLQPIMEKFNNKTVIDNNDTGYYKTNFCSLSSLCQNISLMEQIRLREYSERTNQYSVALNHLLNEIQVTCCLLEGQNIKSYKAPMVDKFLAIKLVPNSHRTKIKNLFDRRNNNPVAHPGSDISVAWPVSESEYFVYKKHVGSVLDKII